MDVMAASFLLNLLSLALPLVILQAYDRIIPNAALDTFTLMLLALGGAVLGTAALSLIRTYINAWAAARFDHVATCRAVERLLVADSTSVHATAPGVQLDRINAVDQLRSFYSGQGLTALVDLPFIVLFIGLIAVIAGPLALVPTMMLALLAVLTVLAGQRLRASLVERNLLDGRRSNFLIEVMGGIHSVKALALERLMARRLDRLQASSAAAVHATTMRSTLAQSIGSTVANMTMFATVSVGSLLVLAGDMTVGMLAACTMLSGRSVQPFLRAVGAWTQLQGIKVAEDRYRALMSLPTESNAAAAPMPAITGAVRLDKVTYGYPGTAEPLFRDLDLEVRAGEMVAITGGNGSGKSSLLWLIMGLVAPQSGTVSFDGHTLARFDQRTVRAQIGYLPQRAQLLRGSILDNLTMFRGEEYIDTAMTLARKLGLDSVLARLPDGLETQLGDTTYDILPSGVRQQIGVVRGLVTRPKLILFDEANSSFDMEMDKRMKELLQDLRGSATIIVISYRPSVLTIADRGFRIAEGRLVPVDPSSFAAPPAAAPQIAPPSPADRPGTAP
ncbi:MAG: ATP-binding cassette domain-containing protein [Rhodospirillaceae bacterium]|nr:ATP-binding cassette domain-containing protein [Rhodospirillaceae bacterium]